MLRSRPGQESFYSILYERIPENHLLKRIEGAVDFSFVNELLADNYLALVQFACAIIVWRKPISVHLSFWDKLRIFREVM